MKHIPLLVFIGVVVEVGLTGCAGGAQPSDIRLPESTSYAATSLLVPDNIQDQWTRPIQPESNSSFTTINGNPYYRLGTGDELELTIGLEDGPSQFQLAINPEGYIQLPPMLLRERVHVAGLAIPQVEERLSAALANVLRYPDLTLRVTNYQYSTVILIGAITQRIGGASTGEGRYPLTGRTTLLDFILTYSAFTDDTDITAVIITDSEGRSGMFDLSATIYGGDQSHNPVLDRDDVVTVPSFAETRRYIYVLGEVTNPSLLNFNQGITVLDAISRAGGPTQRARQKWISLVHGRGQDVEFTQIPYSSILRKGNVEWNLPLAPGDIIYVGRSTYSSSVEFFRDVWVILQSAVVASILAESLR